MPVLAFNEKGQIDAILFDKIEGLEDPSPLDFANANLLFTCAKTLGITPGKKADTDDLLVGSLISMVSPTITNPNIVANEIVTSWNKIADSHYSDPTSRVRTIGAYARLFDDYFTTLNTTMALSPFFFPIIELLLATKEQRAFNPFAPNAPPPSLFFSPPDNVRSEVISAIMGGFDKKKELLEKLDADPTYLNDDELAYLNKNFLPENSALKAKAALIIETKESKSCCIIL